MNGLRTTFEVWNSFPPNLCEIPMGRPFPLTRHPSREEAEANGRRIAALFPTRRVWVVERLEAGRAGA